MQIHADGDSRVLRARKVWLSAFSGLAARLLPGHLVEPLYAGERSGQRLLRPMPSMQDDDGVQRSRDNYAVKGGKATSGIEH